MAVAPFFFSPSPFLQISDSLCFPWRPMDDEDIPDCVWFPYDVFNNSPEAYYLPFLLEGQNPLETLR